MGGDGGRNNSFPPPIVYRRYYESVYVAAVTIANFPISLLATSVFGTIVYFSTGAFAVLFTLCLSS